MERKYLAGCAVLAALLAYSLAQAQNVSNPADVAGAGAYNSAAPTCTAGQFCRLQTDVNGNLKTVGASQAAATVGITPTDRTITSATGASQQIMAANASRHSITVVNTGAANCGINPTGGSASIGGAGTLTLVPFGSYTPRVPTLSAVTAICTAGQPLYADEN